jgi:hypothetical protein
MKPLPCLCLFAWLCLPLHAKDLAAYRIGDIAEADITTPVALDVVDAAATTALQSAKATEYPAVFRSLPVATNELARDFLAAYAQAHSNFLAGLAGEFHTPEVAATTIASADFGRFVTAFGVEHKDFPISDDLAAEWARGGDGQVIQQAILGALLRAANRHLLPETLPKDIVIGEAIRLVPVTDETQKLSFETVQQGQLAPAASLTTVSNAQTLFRREFPAGQELFARALAAWLKPNCFLDAPFTQLTRGTAVYQLIVSDHFDAGDAIVHRGDKIDAKLLAALAMLNEKLKSSPTGPTDPAVTASVTKAQSPPPPTNASVRPGSAQVAAVSSPPHPPQPAPQKPTLVTVTNTKTTVSTQPNPALKANSNKYIAPLVLTLAGAATVALLVAFWKWLKLKPQTSNLDVQPVALGDQLPLPPADANLASVGPQVSQVVREAVQQELGSQRRDLLLAQQAATGEIAALVHRLDELQVPLQERLRAYETRIQTLEKELALRNEENRQLLTMKIEMVNRQMETERAGALVPPV